jgi:hypothetical protein
MFTVLEVSAGEGSLLVKTTGDRFKTGDQVELGLAPGYEFHQLP